MNAPRDPNVITPRGPKGVALPAGNFSPANFVGDPKSGKFVDWDQHFGARVAKDPFLAKAEWAARDNPADAHFGGGPSAAQMAGKFDDRLPDGSGDNNGRPYQPGITGDDPFEGSGAASVHGGAAPGGDEPAPAGVPPAAKMGRAMPFQDQIFAAYGADFGRQNAEGGEYKPVQGPKAPEASAPNPGAAAKMHGEWPDMEAGLMALMSEAQTTVDALTGRMTHEETVHGTAPKKYAEGGATKKDFADRKGLKYPVDTEAHTRAAISYFSKPANHGIYTPEKRAKIWGRIKKAAKKFGIEVSDTSGPVAGKMSDADREAVATRERFTFPGEPQPPTATAGAPSALRPRPVEPRESEAVKGLDAAFAGLDSLVKSLEPMSKAGSHKYISRKANGKGGYDYVYKHPVTGEHHEVQVHPGSEGSMVTSHGSTIDHPGGNPSVHVHASDEHVRGMHESALRDAHAAKLEARTQSHMEQERGKATADANRATQKADADNTAAAHSHAAKEHERAARANPRGGLQSKIHEKQAEKHRKAASSRSKFESPSFPGNPGRNMELFGVSHPPREAEEQASRHAEHLSSKINGVTNNAEKHEAAASAHRSAAAHHERVGNEERRSAHIDQAKKHEAIARKDRGAPSSELSEHIRHQEAHPEEVARTREISAKPLHEQLSHTAESASAHANDPSKHKFGGAANWHREAMKAHTKAADAHERAGSTEGAAKHRAKAEQHRNAFQQARSTEKSMDTTVTDTAGRPLSKGLYAYRLPTGEKTTPVPEEYLYDYLCAFIEQAYEHESGEVEHSKLDAHDQVKTMAENVMHCLVGMLPFNENLLRACKKFSVTKDTVERLLVEKGYYKPRSDSEFTDDGLGAMGAHLLQQEGMEFSHEIAPFLSEDAFAVPGLRLRGPIEQSADGMVKSEEPVDPHTLLGARAERAARQMWAESYALPADVKPIPDCPVHGGRDIHKAQSLHNPLLPCICTGRANPYG